MSQKRTYITLINEFWERYPLEPISAPASMVYFYLLNRINRNRWEPVFISDVEIAEALNISRRRLPDYKAILADAGLITFENNGTGRTAGTRYNVAQQTAPKGTVNCAQRNSLRDTKCAKRRSSKKQTAPKGTVNCAQRNSLEASTPYNIDKTYIRPYSTTTKDTRQGAAAVVEVEAVEVEVLEALPEAKNETSKYADLQKKAAGQGAELLKIFFAKSNQVAIDTLCMQNHMTPADLRAIAARVIEDWTQEGTCHDTFNGDFDLRGAIKHLRHTIPIKAAAERRQQKTQGAQTRDEKRQSLMAGAINNLNQAIANQHRAKDNSNKPF